MAQTPWEVLGAIADQRGRKGRQFSLPAVLAIAVAAMLAGANDLRAIFRWGRRLKPEALALFGIKRAPCHATYFYVFRSLDGDALARALGGFAGRDGSAGAYRHRWQNAEGQPPGWLESSTRCLRVCLASVRGHRRSRGRARRGWRPAAFPPPFVDLPLTDVLLPPRTLTCDAQC
jgi:DDE_Tnp_1-associated